MNQPDVRSDALRYRIQERFVLNDGTHIVRMISRGPVAPHAGDLMQDFMIPLGTMIDRARETQTSLCIHGGEGGKKGQFVVPPASVSYAMVDVVDEQSGDFVRPKPGYLNEEHSPPVPRTAVVRDLRRRPDATRP
jgi:hypothetical protein